MIELIVQIFGEFVIQAMGEALIELGFHSLAEPFRKPPNPWLAALGYMIFGAVFGGLSLLVVSSHFVPQPWRILNLILTPIAVGGMMSLMGSWRARRGDALVRIDRFTYGYLFALSFALIRFIFAS
jgi:hypothetical protein